MDGTTVLLVIVLLFVRQAERLANPHLPLPAEAWFVVGVLSSVAVGLAFCRHVEQPLLARLNRRREVAVAGGRADAPTLAARPPLG